VPQDIHSAAAFEAWRKDAERADPKLLYLRREDLMRHEAAGITTDNFPHEVKLGPSTFRLEYQFEPGSPRDGVTMTVPVALLNQVPAARCEWLVPGLLKEKVRALAKSMPQRLRHKLGPLDAFADDFAAAVPPSDAPLALALARHIRSELNFDVPLDAFRPDSAPPHLHMNFLVVDEHQRQLALGKDLAALKKEFSAGTEAVLQQEAHGELYRGWTMGDLAEIMEIDSGGQTLVGYPALVDQGEAVSLQVFDSPEKAKELHRAGVRRLLGIAFRERVRDLEKMWSKDPLLGPLQADLVAAALDRAFLGDAVPMQAAEFARAVEAGRSRFVLIAQEMARTAVGILAEHAALQKKLSVAAKNFPRESEDVKRQLERLLGPGWLARTSWPRLQHFARYLNAASLRLDKLRADPSRDARLAAEIAPLQAAWLREVAAQARYGAPSSELEQFGWLLEELRVALFAQELKTPVPISAKRLGKLWQSMRK
jgi:ATP-dependent helicase HrpA